MHLDPVCTATCPFASTIATWRTASCGSAAISASSACCAVFPAFMSSRPSGPYETSVNDCVATAPTPASAHTTCAPTENQCDCTATPSSPVVESRATMEYVCTGRATSAANDTCVFNEDAIPTTVTAINNRLI